jgi:hypothetical protein
MGRLIQRVVVFALALGVTLAVFLFWGRLGNALRTTMDIVYAEPKPSTAPADNPDEVTATIVPVSKTPACTKHHPCAVPKP